MHSVRIEVGAADRARTFYLTDYHEEATNGVPVLMDVEERGFGPWEVPFESGQGLTARAIARYALKDHPGDEEVADLVRRFESVAMPSTSTRAASAEAEPQEAAVSPKVNKEQVSLYDYYAGQALVGLLTRSVSFPVGGTQDLIVRQTGEIAEAMLAARASRMGSDAAPPLSD